MKEYGLEEKELGEFNAVISGVLIPELIRIADKYNYNRDSMIKFAADTLTAMSELSTFERYKAATRRKVGNDMKVSEAHTIDVKALDMETKKVVTFPTVPCPNCGKWILVNHNHRFCEYCGEQLEWEESDERNN